MKIGHVILFILVFGLLSVILFRFFSSSSSSSSSSVVLVLGAGTIGKPIIEALLVDGYHVVVISRSHQTFDPSVHHILADRKDDLSHLLNGYVFAAIIDACADYPEQIQPLQTSLYVLISSTSVYDVDRREQYNENSKLYSAKGQEQGSSKVAVEEEAKKKFPSLCIIRPTYVVGPSDTSGRFSYWVKRLQSKKASKVIVPKPKNALIQILDSRDLAHFIVSNVLRNSVTGVYNLASPPKAITFEHLLNSINSILGNKATLVWISWKTLEKYGIDSELIPSFNRNVDEWENVDASKTNLISRSLEQIVLDIAKSKTTKTTDHFLSEKQENLIISKIES